MLGLLSRLESALSERYTDLREIGRGGTATVYHALDRKHQRPVAIKVLHPELTTALGSQRFLREIEIAAGLTHPHILALHDSGEADGLLYYVMPYVEGETLRELLVREKQLPVEEAIRIASEVGSALDHAHEHGVVHRDIKPENILLPARKACVADFGLARAIERAASDRLTGTGVAMGTPAYISPEQATGDRDVDGRSDLYSLACVLFEMLAGVPPFRGPTVQSIVARHLGDPPPRVRAFRAAVPQSAEAALMKAMAKKPDERFRSAAEFIAAVNGTAKPARARWRWWPFALIALVIAGGVYAASKIRGRKPLDPKLFAVLPFEHRSGAAPMLLDGEQCERLLYDSFTRWEDIRLVDPMRINDERAQRGGKPISVTEGVEIARKLGAGKLARGEVWEFGDSIHVRAVLYDVARGADRVREHSVAIARDLRGHVEKFIELATTLMAGHAQTPGVAADALGAHSDAAWRAYDRGRAALNKWDLPVAERELRTAITLDPQYPHAHLWLSQVIGWSGEPARDWRTIANRTVVLGDGLAPRGRRLAEALLAIAEARFADACAIYREMITRDSTDFAAWYGLGECHMRDEAVVPDALSPSKWRFRSSYHAAMEAYSRALQVLPSVHMAFRDVGFSRLQRLMFTESWRYRPGFATTTDTLRFAAFADLKGDTLAFVPYPLADVLTARKGVPARGREALARNRERLRRITGSWLDAFPRSPHANETLARVLEASGAIEDGDSRSRSALQVVREARKLAPEPLQRLRLAASEARLLVKSGQFTGARALADSLLSAWPQPDAPESEELAGLAMLTGRVERTAELLGRSAGDFSVRAADGQLIHPSVPIGKATLALHAHASAGSPAEALRAREAGVIRLLHSYVAVEERSRVGGTLLAVPLSLSVPVLGPDAVKSVSAGTSRLIPIQQAVARGDTAGARRQFADLRRVRRGLLPGDVSIDATFQEAWLHLVLGDTTRAIEHLDLSLNALPTLGSALLNQVSQIAALVRAMALRAELAAARGERTMAQPWSRAVVILWERGDPEVQPLVQRMRRLAM